MLYEIYVYYKYLSSKIAYLTEKDEHVITLNFFDEQSPTDSIPISERPLLS